MILEEENPVPALQRMAEFAVMPALAPAINFDRKMEELFGKLREVIVLVSAELSGRTAGAVVGLPSGAVLKRSAPQDVKDACARILLTRNAE